VRCRAIVDPHHDDLKASHRGRRCPIDRAGCCCKRSPRRSGLDLRTGHAGLWRAAAAVAQGAARRDDATLDLLEFCANWEGKGFKRAGDGRES